MSLGLKYKNNEQIFAERQRGGVPYLSYPLLENTGIVNHGFSTRLGGVSTGCFSSMNISLTRGDDPEAVKKNRELIAQAIGVEVADFTYTQQTHTTNVKRVYARERGQSFPETDGMITDVPGICLVTSYADCVPLYFVDPVKKVIGLSHSGWRGTVGKIGKVTVEKMEEEFGCDPADILGAVGPSICQDCYEVSEDVIKKFPTDRFIFSSFDSHLSNIPYSFFQHTVSRFLRITILHFSMLHPLELFGSFDIQLLPQWHMPPRRSQTFPRKSSDLCKM